jgi:hypothetical protein
LKPSAVLAVRLHREMDGDHVHQPLQFLVGQVGGRAAPQVQLLDALARLQLAGHERDLARQKVQVLDRLAVVARHHLVAGAVVADGIAERDMHVHGQRRGRHHRARPQPARVSVGVEGLDEAVGGGVGSVTRARNVEASQ